MVSVQIAQNDVFLSNFVTLRKNQRKKLSTFMELKSLKNGVIHGVIHVIHKNRRVLKAKKEEKTNKCFVNNS